MNKSSVAPPPVIDCARRLSYAIVDNSVEFTGHCGMFVDGKPLGPVSCFAVCRNLPDGQILVLYCTEDWESVAASGSYSSVDEAKASLERGYRGIGAKWVDAPGSDADVLEYLNFHWPACSFCGKRGFEIQRMVQGKNAQICDECLSKFSSSINVSLGAT